MKKKPYEQTKGDMKADKGKREGTKSENRMDMKKHKGKKC